MRKHLIWARAKANDRFFTWCSSILRSKQQPRVISPSVAPLYPLGAPAPSSEGAEAAPPQTADLLSVSAVEPRTHSIASVRNSVFRIPNSALLCAATPSKCDRTARAPQLFIITYSLSKKPAEAGFLLFTHISLQATMSIPVPRTSCRSTSPHLTGEVTLILFISSITSKIFSLGMSPLVLTGMRG